MAGEVTVSLDNVKEMHVHGTFAVLRKGVVPTLQNVHPGSLTYEDGSMTVENPQGNASVPEKEIAFIVDENTFHKQLQNPGFFHAWTGSASAGATSVQSTNYGTTFTLGLNMVRAIPTVAYLPPRNRMTLNVNETYGKLTQPVIPNPTNLPASVAKTSIFHTDFERDQYISPRFYGLGDLSLDHNFSQGLNLQQVYGGGFGWTVLKSPKQELDLKTDVHYEKQQFLPTAGTVDQNLIGSTFSENYTRTLPAKILLTESGSVLPAWNNMNAYTANGAINVALPTYKKLTVNVGLTDSFINDPPIGYHKNSFQFTTGLGYTF